jgi:hypothetical protein
MMVMLPMLERSTRQGSTTMAHKEQHHNRKDQKKPKKARQPDQVTGHRSGFVEQINANEAPHVKP